MPNVTRIAMSFAINDRGIASPGDSRGERGVEDESPMRSVLPVLLEEDIRVAATG